MLKYVLRWLSFLWLKAYRLIPWFLTDFETNLFYRHSTITWWSNFTSSGFCFVLIDLLCINFFDEEGGRKEIAPILGCCIGDGYLEVGIDWIIRFFEETPLTWIVYGCVLRVLGFLRDVLGVGWSVNFRTLIDFVIKIYKLTSLINKIL